MYVNLSSFIYLSMLFILQTIILSYNKPLKKRKEKKLISYYVMACVNVVNFFLSANWYTFLFLQKAKLKFRAQKPPSSFPFPLVKLSKPMYMIWHTAAVSSLWTYGFGEWGSFFPPESAEHSVLPETAVIQGQGSRWSNYRLGFRFLYPEAPDHFLLKKQNDKLFLPKGREESKRTTRSRGVRG